MARKKAVSVEEKIISAALEVAETKSWRAIGLDEIANAAKVSLADLRAVFSTRADILSAFVKQVDEKMLASLEKEAVDGDAHDRLFEVIMRRLEILEPHKKAIAGIMCCPASGAGEAVRLCFAADSAARWMLTAAGIGQTGCRGKARRAGLGLVMARTIDVWLRDDDPGHARTMAALDRHLRSGASWLRLLDLPCGLAGAFCSLGRGFMRARRRPEPAGADAAGAVT